MQLTWARIMVAGKEISDVFLGQLSTTVFSNMQCGCAGQILFSAHVSQRALDRTRCKAGTFLLWGIRQEAALFDQHVQYDPVTICLRRAWTFWAGERHLKASCRLGFKEANDSWAWETKEM